MPLPDSLTIPTQVMARQVGDETVILDLASGNYFGLDPVGARVWQLVTEGKSVAQVCAIVLTEYQVTPEQLERDLERLFGQLSAHGLLTLG